MVETWVDIREKVMVSFSLAAGDRTKNEIDVKEF
jgi:hypothetical protein